MGVRRGHTRTRLEAPLALLLAALLLAATAAAATGYRGPASPCPRASLPPARATLHQMRTSMLCLVNAARRRHGLAALRYSAALRHAASGHSADMVRHGYFAHSGSNGSTVGARVAGAGYLRHSEVWAVGENIGGGGSRHGSALAVFRGWMHDPPHRANVLDPRFRDFGAGVARGFPPDGRRGAATYTLDLGTRR